MISSYLVAEEAIRVLQLTRLEEKWDALLILERPELVRPDVAVTDTTIQSIKLLGPAAARPCPSRHTVTNTTPQ